MFRFPCEGNGAARSGSQTHYHLFQVRLTAVLNCIYKLSVTICMSNAEQSNVDRNADNMRNPNLDEYEQASADACDRAILNCRNFEEKSQQLDDP
jgi:hypothetical protein